MGGDIPAAQTYIVRMSAGLSHNVFLFVRALWGILRHVLGGAPQFLNKLLGLPTATGASVALKLARRGTGAGFRKRAPRRAPCRRIPRPTPEMASPGPQARQPEEAVCVRQRHAPVEVSRRCMRSAGTARRRAGPAAPLEMCLRRSQHGFGEKFDAPVGIWASKTRRAPSRGRRPIRYKNGPAA